MQSRSDAQRNYRSVKASAGGSSRIRGHKNSSREVKRYFWQLSLFIKLVFVIARNRSRSIIFKVCAKHWVKKEYRLRLTYLGYSAVFGTAGGLSRLTPICWKRSPPLECYVYRQLTAGSRKISFACLVRQHQMVSARVAPLAEAQHIWS